MREDPALSVVTRRRRRLGRLVAGLVIAAGGVLAAAPGASAGGFALTTLDAVPTPVPGEPTDVGFTILQHGVTPVDIDEGVELVVMGPNGTTVFPAERDGRVGHYVATIRVPANGSYRWFVRQGWFGEQSLGMFVTSDGGVASAGGWQAPKPLAPGLVGLACVFAGLAVVDALRGRRRPVIGAAAGVPHGTAPHAT